MVCSSVRGLKEVERILRNKKYIVVDAPKNKIDRKYETAKEAVNRKIKNSIGIMVLNDGTFKYLNELNISYEMAMATNVSFIKSYNTSKLIPVYYKHKDM